MFFIINTQCLANDLNDEKFSLFHNNLLVSNGLNLIFLNSLNTFFLSLIGYKTTTCSSATSCWIKVRNLHFNGLIFSTDAWWTSL